ncbi:MAG: uroporphyrinogen-III C-methyltransferase [Lysobacterales bacterium]
MNIDISETATDPGANAAGNGAARDKQPRGGGTALALLALLCALAALAGTGWLWWQDRLPAGQERQALAANLASEISRLEGSDGALSAGLDELRAKLEALAAEAGGGEALANLRGGMAADRERLVRLEQSLQEQTALSRSLQAATDALQARLLVVESGMGQLSALNLGAAEELDLAEVDYLLRLASERLQLFSDPATADRSLELADRQLAALDDPAHLGVRQAIAAARRDLASLSLPDYLQVTARLDEIQASIARWPFAGDSAAGSAAGVDAGTETGWWARLKTTFASLVTVRRSAGTEPVLSLEDKDYVRQRVWLQLELAQLALMRRDQQAFRAALAQAQDSLATRFDPADDAVQAAGRSLSDLAAMDLEAKLPDITEPWNTLRLIRRHSEPSQPAAPASPPEPAPATGNPEDADQ